MARLYGSMHGQGKTTRTCIGSASSGISAHIRGWNIGVHIDIEGDPNTEKDRISIYSTHGSNDPTIDKILASFDGETWRIYANNQ